MRFGILSNGFRPHTTAAATYAEDLYEIVLADELGFGEAWISEHHAQPLYINTVDTLPIPELLITQAAGLTRRIRMGPAVKLIHLSHPVDVATLAAVTDHLTGGRYMFGFGSGFATPLFSEERGLSYEQRHARLAESLELILTCWTTEAPFDWDGAHWHGRGITVLPKPFQAPHMPMAVATATEATIQLAAARGYTVLTGGSAAYVRKVGATYAAAANGRANPLDALSVIQAVYLSDSVDAAVQDLRPAVSLELEYQKARGLLGRSLANTFAVSPAGSADVTFDDLVALGRYVVGDPERVFALLRDLYVESGGFGTLLLVVGKDWATRAKRERSLRLFMQEVAPRLAELEVQSTSTPNQAAISAGVVRVVGRGAETMRPR